MAVVVVNFPVTMMSISETALDKEIGVRHRIEKIVGPSSERAAFTNRDAYLGDVWNVWTICGKQVDAVLETGQDWRECSGCNRTKKIVPDYLMVRVISTPQGNRAPRWNDMYWEEGRWRRSPSE